MPSTASHDQILERAAGERAGIRGYWLLHPAHGMLMVYAPLDGACGKPDVFEACRRVAVAAVPDVVASWVRVLRKA